MKPQNNWWLFSQKISKAALCKRASQVLKFCCALALGACLTYAFQTRSKQNLYDFDQPKYGENVAKETTKKQKDEAKATVFSETKKEKNKSIQQPPLDKINLNQATKEMLMQIPHIGAKKAEDIIKYREHTAFTRIEDLLEVKGIGEKIFEKIADFITV